MSSFNALPDQDGLADAWAADLDEDPQTIQATWQNIVASGRTATRKPRRFPAWAQRVLIGLVLAVILVAIIASQTGASYSWPASVTRVQQEVTTACHNPDVRAAVSRVNFACGQNTRQILWDFAILTSGANPSYSDVSDGREGLEPIAPQQGGEIAWSLNLSHPYNPLNPLDSIEVAARAINNLIGGATVTTARGHTIVQPGLEGIAANCQRYTGSTALRQRSALYPPLCAKPLTSAGQAALVSDVLLKWMPGVAPSQGQDASILFENPNNPGDPKVQEILKREGG